MAEEEVEKSGHHKNAAREEEKPREEGLMVLIGLHE